MKKRRRKLLAVAAAFLLGASVSIMWRLFFMERPVSAASRVQVSMDMDQDASSAALERQLPGEGVSEKRYVVWSQKAYSAPLSMDVVATLVREGRAEQLQFRLTRENKENLDKETRDVDMALRDVAKVYQDSIADAKRKLWNIPDRRIIITTRPRQDDPNYRDLLSAQMNVENGKGAVWGDVVDGHEIHAIVYWDEWPELRALFDDQVSLVEERNVIARRWIEERYQEQGMSLFQVD